MNEPPPLPADSTRNFASPGDPSKSVEATKVVDFQQLACGAREVLIVYQDQTYRLRLTKNHKLILTK